MSLHGIPSRKPRPKALRGGGASSIRPAQPVLVNGPRLRKDAAEGCRSTDAARAKGCRVTDGFSIRPGLPQGLRHAAARIYWDAFGPKLGAVLGPEPRARAFLVRALREDHCIAAVAADGTLLGLAGFRTPEGSFAGGTRDDLRAVYGRFGGLWRAALLGLLSRDVEQRRFLLDGLCVAPEARGRGVGRALIAAICAEAARRGHAEVRLDVVDTNTRARALYERLGFRPEGTQAIGLLRLVFRFRSATTMVRPAT
jgi:ribosomal protein S18 acetylase RimI-like enzyme